MKTQNGHRFVCCLIFILVLIAVFQVKVQADGQEEQWIVFRDQIPESATRYRVKLKYTPSDSSLYKAFRGDIKSIALPDEEQIGDYKERVNFGMQVDGYQYSILLRRADELTVLNRDRTKILMIRIIRSKPDEEPEIVQEGFYVCGNYLEFPFEMPGQKLALPVTVLVSSILSFNVHSGGSDSYQGASIFRLWGSISGSLLIEDATLNVSLLYKDSLDISDQNVSVEVKPFDDKMPPEFAEGKITDILKLRSATLVVEKVTSDSSEIVLAAVQGKIGQAPDVESFLGIGKPVPAFARVDLIGRQLLTLDKLQAKAGSRGYIVLIFGELKRIYSPEDFRRGEHQMPCDLRLDETMILNMLQKDLKSPPVVVFICRRLLLSDLYEKWLDKSPEFYLVADYSNPMDVQFQFISPYGPRYPRRPEKRETLRGKFSLPENMVSILAINGKGKLVYIDVDAGSHLAKCLVEVNELISSKK